MGYERRVKPPPTPPDRRQPHLGEAAREAEAERKAREARALRANLQRRKQQARARGAPAPGREDEPQ